MFHCRGNLWVRMLDSKYEGLKGLDEGGVKSCESIWWRDLKLVCGREHDRWFDVEFVEFVLDCVGEALPCLLGRLKLFS